MSCDLYTEYIMKYFDGELNDIEVAQLKLHLKSCKACNGEFDALNSILGCMENDLNIEPPPDFEAQVMDKIRVMELSEKRKPGVLKIMMLAMGAILTFLAASALVYSILGISIFKIMSGVLSDSPVFSNIFDSVGTVFEGGIPSIIDYIGTIFEVGLILAKTHYYIVVLIAVLLFALQWMVVGIIKQNLEDQKRVVPNIH